MTIPPATTPNAGPPTLRFPTKVDAWLAALVALALAAPIAAAVVGLRTPADPRALWVGLALLAAPAIIALVSIPTRYELHADTLLIRSGVVRWRIPYSDLREVRPTHNPLSAPAWSLDRLKLTRSSGYALISPRDKSGFLHELGLRAPHLTRQGERLVSR